MGPPQVAQGPRGTRQRTRHHLGPLQGVEEFHGHGAEEDRHEPTEGQNEEDEPHGETVVELWDWRIAPSDSFEGGPHIDGAIEMLMIHSGVLTLHLNDQSFDVPAGSAVRFNAGFPHTYANHGDEELRLTMVTVEPAH